MVNVPSETQLAKTNVSFARGCELEIDSWLRVGAGVHSPLSTPGILPDLNLGRPCPVPELVGSAKFCTTLLHP